MNQGEIWWKVKAAVGCGKLSRRWKICRSLGCSPNSFPRNEPWRWNFGRGPRHRSFAFLPLAARRTCRSKPSTSSAAQTIYNRAAVRLFLARPYLRAGRKNHCVRRRGNIRAKSSRRLSCDDFGIRIPKQSGAISNNQKVLCHSRMHLCRCLRALDAIQTGIF